MPKNGYYVAVAQKFEHMLSVSKFHIHPSLYIVSRNKDRDHEHPSVNDIGKWLYLFNSTELPQTYIYSSWYFFPPPPRPKNRLLVSSLCSSIIHWERSAKMTIWNPFYLLHEIKIKPCIYVHLILEYWVWC